MNSVIDFYGNRVQCSAITESKSSTPFIHTHHSVGSVTQDLALVPEDMYWGDIVDKLDLKEQGLSWSWQIAAMENGVAKIHIHDFGYIRALFLPVERDSAYLWAESDCGREVMIEWKGSIKNTLIDIRHLVEHQPPIAYPPTVKFHKYDDESIEVLTSQHYSLAQLLMDKDKRDSEALVKEAGIHPSEFVRKGNQEFFSTFEKFDDVGFEALMVTYGLANLKTRFARLPYFVSDEWRKCEAITHDDRLVFFRFSDSFVVYSVYEKSVAIEQLRFDVGLNSH